MIHDHMFADDVPHVKLSTEEQWAISKIDPATVDMRLMRSMGADHYVSVLEALSVNPQMTIKQIEKLNAEITQHYYGQFDGSKTAIDVHFDTYRHAHRLASCMVELMAHPNLEPKLISNYLGVRSPHQGITPFNGVTFNPSVSTDQVFEFLKLWTSKHHCTDTSIKYTTRQILLHFKHESPWMMNDLFNILLGKTIIRPMYIAGVAINHPECTPEICFKFNDYVHRLIRVSDGHAILHFKHSILQLIQHKNFDRGAADTLMYNLLDFTSDLDYSPAEAREVFAF